MSRENLRSKYAERIKHFQKAIEQETKRINLLSLARLLVLVATVWILALGIKHQSLLFFLLSVPLFPLFLILVTIYNRYKEQRELLRQFLALNQTEFACLDHDYHSLPDGAEYADTSHPWSHDLDLFGTGSLFQYMNRTSTLKGKELLASRLIEEPGSVEMIHERQEIISDLKERIEFRQHLCARGKLVEEKAEDYDELAQWLNSSAYIRKHPWLFYLAILVSALVAGIIIWGIFNSRMFWLLAPLTVVNFFLLSPFLMRTNRYQALISKKHRLLQGYAQLLKIISGESFTHPHLKSLAEQAQTGMKEVRQLSRLLNAFDQRLSMLIGAIINGFFLFDFIMMHLLENWKERNQKEILNWIELVGWTDAMVSLSGFAWNHPDFSLPEIGIEDKPMEMEGLGHPLIPDGKRVNNQMEIKSEKIVVITGANMAGKSTFLRSLGVNMVLAYTGCPVCATSFRCTFMGMYSSMRTADSLKDEESYFLAEIKKLQSIVQEMLTGRPLLILLDEVLKGTNTTDKKLGSVGLIRKSLNYPVRCFIATHDLSLGELEKEHKGQVVNFCFESYINDMELSFDYTMRKGIATNMNASFLMKKMGIMD
jgi:ABC-type multidrug transport system fused ATPase/permease subunit